VSKNSVLEELRVRRWVMLESSWAGKMRKKQLGVGVVCIKLMVQGKEGDESAEGVVYA